MEKSKKKIVKAIVCVVLVCMIWGGYFVCNWFVLNRTYKIVEDDFSWVYEIESMEIKESNLRVTGWTFESESLLEGKEYEIILIDEDTEKKYYADMFYEVRTDVNSYFGRGSSSFKAGFTAVFDASRLNLEEKTYRVLLKPANIRVAYLSDVWYKDGGMVSADMLSAERNVLQGTEMEYIIRDGYAKVYDPEEGIYVYQYGEELYWIVEKREDFVDENTFVQYQIDTVRADDLLSGKMNSKKYGFNFTNNELVEFNTEEYRVCKSTIPNENSIARIWTGFHIRGKVWYENFRPTYKFSEKQM